MADDNHRPLAGDAELTLQAKAAIRRYLASIFVPSGIVAVILAAIVGYLVHDIAQKEAELTATANANARVDELAKTANERVDKLTKTANESVDKLTKTANDSVDKLTDKIDKAQTDLWNVQYQSDRVTKQANDLESRANSKLSEFDSVLMPLAAKAKEATGFDPTSVIPSLLENLKQDSAFKAELANSLPASKIAQSLKLDCKVIPFHAAPSNNFQTPIPTPPGYKLVGGSCAFDEWHDGDNPTLIQVGPLDDSGSSWSCFAKQSRAVAFTATATFCRITSADTAPQ